MSEIPCNYSYTFVFNDTFDIQDMILPEGVKLLRNQDNRVKAAEITTNGKEAETHATAHNLAKKLVALLSLYTNREIRARRESWRRVRPDGHQEIFLECSESLSTSCSFTVSGMPPVDLTNAFKKTDVKSWRQLTHFQKGNGSPDPIERYREFYQVLEEDKHASFSETALRHAINHPLLDVKKYADEVSKILGSKCFDPTNDEHRRILTSHAEQIRQKALKLLLGKFVNENRP